mgnify:CR=1 FL=1
MDQRAVDTLAWFDSLSAEVESHPGAAYAEVEILRMLVTETGPYGVGLLATAYRRDLERRLVPVTNRAEARALAHYLMFATNFNRVGIVLGSNYSERMDGLLAEYEEDTDTLGELLICCRILQHETNAVTAAQAAFDSAWSTVGREDFQQNYHCILVGGILYSLG